MTNGIDFFMLYYWTDTLVSKSFGLRNCPIIQEKGEKS